MILMSPDIIIDVSMIEVVPVPLLSGAFSNVFVLLVSINIKLLYYLLEILIFSPPKTYFRLGFDCSEYFFFV